MGVFSTLRVSIFVVIMSIAGVLAGNNNVV